MSRKYFQGKFRPMNPEKYKGDITNICYRSSWEFFFLQKLDLSPNVLEYSSEEVVVPYRCPTDNKMHRYFPDFWVKQKTKEGIIEEILVEVKPYKETIPPKVQSGKKPTKRYLTEVMTWGKNSAKWAAAEAYCAKRGWRFEKVTERELGITF